MLGVTGGGGCTTTGLGDGLATGLGEGLAGGFGARGLGDGLARGLGDGLVLVTGLGGGEGLVILGEGAGVTGGLLGFTVIARLTF